MVELTVCKSCSAPIAPGHALCPGCGAALDATEAAPEPTAPEPTAVDDLQRATAREAAAWAAAVAREAAAQAAAATAAAVNAIPDIEAEGDADSGVGLTPGPVAVDDARTSDRYLAPSATYRTLGSIGGGRPDIAGRPDGGGRPAGIVPGPRGPVPAAAPRPSPAIAPIPVPAPAHDGALAGRSAPFGAEAMGPASPGVPVTASDRIRATLASIAAEPKAELVATGLTALGGAFALISFFLPWTADNGLGIGTIDLHPRPGAWAFDTAAGWPLFLFAAILLASILASDKLEELMPGLAPTIRRLTEVAMPMLLGGVLLGAGLMYQMLPWGCGGGIALLLLGAVLLIAGSIVGLFYPAQERRG